MRRVLLFCSAMLLLLLTACSVPAMFTVRPSELPRGQTLSQLHLEQIPPDRHICAWIPYFSVTALCAGGTEESCRSAVSEYLGEAQRFHITDVFLHVCAFGEAFYPSDYYPPAPEAMGLDIMQIFTDLCPQYGIALHAWINPLRLQTADRIDSMEGDQRLAAWCRAQQTRTANLSLWEGRYYLDPARPAVRAFLAAAAAELTERYHPAGIHIDDYFYPTTDVRFDALAFAESGAESLAAWRTENISQTVQGMYQAVHAAVDDTVFSVSPQGDPELDRTELYADVSRWMREPGFCDIMLPQIYFGYQNEFSPFTVMLDKWRAMPRDSAVELLPGLAAYKSGAEDAFAGSGQAEWQTDSTVLTRQAVQLLTAPDLSGAAFYHLDALLALPETEQKRLQEALRPAAKENDSDENT